MGNPFSPEVKFYTLPAVTSNWDPHSSMVKASIRISHPLRNDLPCTCLAYQFIPSQVFMEPVNQRTGLPKDGPGPLRGQSAQASPEFHNSLLRQTNLKISLGNFHLLDSNLRGHVHMMSAQGGGREGTPKADAVRKLSKGGCVKMQTRGGEGVKKSESFVDVICTWPPTANSIALRPVLPIPKCRF